MKLILIVLVCTMVLAQDIQKSWDKEIKTRPASRDSYNLFYLLILANILRRPIIAIHDEYSRDSDFVPEARMTSG